MNGFATHLEAGDSMWFTIREVSCANYQPETAKVAGQKKNRWVVCFNVADSEWINQMQSGLSTSSLQRCSRGPWAVKVNILPPAVPAVPHPGLLRLARAWAALSIHKLRQADVGDARRVFPDHVHVRVEYGGVNGLAVLWEDWEEEDVKVRVNFCFPSTQRFADFGQRTL